MSSNPLPADEMLRPPGSPAAAELYLELLKNCLTRSIFEEPPASVLPERGFWKQIGFRLRRLFAGREALERRRRADRETGLDWPEQAETMIGRRRLDQLHGCVADVLARGVPGDLMETGVWRGGAVIFLRAALAAYGDRERAVWAADSFGGLPKPDAKRYPADARDRLWSYPQLAVSLEQVKANFARYGLLDERVRFLVGWFRDTLPASPVGPLALLRLDGDLYESTYVALEHLYPKLSPGGWLLVDDYGAIRACWQAVEDFRMRCGITAPMVWSDHSGIGWRKP